jgi:hypothetical protein
MEGMRNHFRALVVSGAAIALLAACAGSIDREPAHPVGDNSCRCECTTPAAGGIDAGYELHMAIVH